MLNLWNKHLHVVENYVGHENIIHLVFKYYVKAIIPIFMICFHWLNPIVQECKANGPSEELNKDDTNIFDVGASIEKSSHALIIGELSLFKRLHPYSQLHVVILLFGATSMRDNFQSNVTFWAKQILCIPRSQIEIDRVF